jgi:hypothetical protein
MPAVSEIYAPSKPLLPKDAVSYIDSGFYQVTSQTAGRLARASLHRELPRPGYCIDVTTSDGFTATLMRTITWGKQVWAIYNLRKPC